MKEIDHELTRNPVNPTLGVEGNIFMPEPGSGEGAPRQPEEPNLTDQERVDPREEAWKRHFGYDNLLVDIRPVVLGHIRDLIGEGKTAPEEEDIATRNVHGNESQAPQGESPSVPDEDLMIMSRFRTLEMTRVLQEVLGDTTAISKFLSEGVGGSPNFYQQEQSITRRLQEAQAMGQGQEEGREKQITVPANLRELVELIMRRESPDWKQGGERELVDENDKVNTVNLLDWFRNNMYKVHSFNPTSPVSFFSDPFMGVKSEPFGTPISFQEIVLTPSYFLEAVAHEENGRQVIKNEKNEDYETLRNQLIYEAFLFQLVRNGDIEYYLNRGEKDKMLGKVNEIYTTNPLTTRRFLEFILTLPSMSKTSIKDLDAEAGHAMDAKKEGNFFMGEGVRRALAAYINIFDYDMLKQILGEEAILFKRDFEDWDADEGKRAIEKHGPRRGELKPDKTITPDPQKPEKRKKWFNEDGTLKLFRVDRKGLPIPQRDAQGKILKDGDGDILYIEDPHGSPHPGYMEYVNLFSGPGPMPDQRKTAEIRERITLSIMKKCDISFREAQLAEAWAYSMTHFTGVAARNDTHSVAFDFWTRLTNTLDYRKRQKAPNRNAKYGAKHTMEGFKRVGLNFFEGARDIYNRTLQDIIQGGNGGKISIEANPVKNDINYEMDHDVDDEGYVRLIEVGGEGDGQDVTRNKKIRRIVEREGDEDVIIYKDENGNAVDLSKIKGLRTTGDHIVFRDTGGRIIAGLTAVRHELYQVQEHRGDKDVMVTRVRFLDSENREVNIGANKPKVEIRSIDKPLDFNNDLMRQFVPNHLLTGAKIYEFLIDSMELNFPDMVKGRDNRGNIIIDFEKLNKMKEGIEHDIRYMLSTWSEINYGDTYRMWERVEKRSPTSKRLIDKDDRELDEEWYVLDSQGFRTDERSEPATDLTTRDMTILESMFGADALKFIQLEIEARKLDSKSVPPKEGKQPVFITVTNPINGEEIQVDLTHAQDKHSDFRLAVWQGAFNYLIATEIEAHRDRSSNLAYWNNNEMENVSDLLIDGQVVIKRQAKTIRKETRTEFSRLLKQDLGYAALTGGGAGLFKALGILYKSLFSER